MSTHYETIQRAESFTEAFHVAPPAALGARDMWPRKPGLCIRARPAEADAPEGATITRELIPAQWGLVPHWVKSASDGKLRATKLVNAVAETAANSKNFRDAWLQNQRCIVPMQAFWVDDLRSGKAVPTRISRVDGKPMAVAGLWASWSGPEGEPLLSYTLLTVNSNSHALMRRYKPAGNDGFMPVILNEGAVDAWLTVRIEKAKEFMRQYPANWLTANPLETKADKIPKGLF
ncbi:SOS response-associated peptidase [Variovorax sp. HJSM1_2]|uniref:SOS response-associated peptidase n=1 Tax=Variovorax sp. HJSM1_2 TaxID=3366263 RepID=UPI003BC9FBF9